MTDITIKFPRPDGEARLEWRQDTENTDGGSVAVSVDGEHVGHGRKGSDD